MYTPQSGRRYLQHVLITTGLVNRIYKGWWDTKNKTDNVIRERKETWTGIKYKRIYNHKCVRRCSASSGMRQRWRETIMMSHDTRTRLEKLRKHWHQRPGKGMAGASDPLWAVSELPQLLETGHRCPLEIVPVSWECPARSDAWHRAVSFRGLSCPVEVQLAAQTHFHQVTRHPQFSDSVLWVFLLSLHQSQAWLLIPHSEATTKREGTVPVLGKGPPCLQQSPPAIWRPPLYILRHQRIGTTCPLYLAL